MEKFRHQDTSRVGRIAGAFAQTSTTSPLPAPAPADANGPLPGATAVGKLKTDDNDVWKDQSPTAARRSA
jgi:hypothetical protein